MAAAYSWPGSLPQIPQQNYSESVGVTVSRVAMDIGRAKHRFISPRADKLNLTYLMTTAQLDIFEDFIKNTIRYTSRFYLTHPRRMARLPEVLPIGYTNIDPVHTTCVRNSIATNIENGVLVTYPINTARYTEGSGVLVEGAATNQLLWSSDLAQWPWAKNRTTVAVGAIIGPTGEAGVSKLVEEAITGAHGVYGNTVSVVAGTAYQATAFLKAGERTRCRLSSWRGDGDTITIVDLAAGTIPYSDDPSAYITRMANGWFLVGHSFVSTITGGNIYSCQVYILDAASSDYYAGDGVSGIYVAGQQLVAATTRQSYIPTTTAPVTRPADVVTASVAQSTAAQVEVVLAFSGDKAYTYTEAAPGYYSVSFEVEVLPL